jgi:hypothetical protein
MFILDLEGKFIEGFCPPILKKSFFNLFLEMNIRKNTATPKDTIKRTQ